jgi:hypothetical protein
MNEIEGFDADPESIWRMIYQMYKIEITAVMKFDAGRRDGWPKL